MIVCFVLAPKYARKVLSTKQSLHFIGGEPSKYSSGSSTVPISPRSRMKRTTVSRRAMRLSPLFCFGLWRCREQLQIHLEFKGYLFRDVMRHPRKQHVHFGVRDIDVVLHRIFAASLAVECEVGVFPISKALAEIKHLPRQTPQASTTQGGAR